MRTTIVFATFLTFGSGVAVVGALNNVALQGSDTLENITRDVIAQCPGAMTNNITYIGGGSTTGGNAMRGANPPVNAIVQNVSPQSRALSQAEGCSTLLGAIPAVDVGKAAEGLVIALDGLAIAAGATNANACGGRVAFTAARTINVTDLDGDGAVECGNNACPGNMYTIADWRDAIALIFGGKHNNHTTAAPSKNCDSDARRALVANWQNLFEDNTCPSGTCVDTINNRQGIRRAFRRSDLSGTTDTFLSLVGLSSMPAAAGPAGTNDFCNGYTSPAVTRLGGDTDYLDLDPIRVTCDDGEEVCSRDGTRGLVTVVTVPANRNQQELYYLSGAAPRICGNGTFRLMPPFSDGIIPPGFRCPNDKATLFQKCFQPVLITGGVPEANCIARTFPVQGFAANGITHGGVYNTVQKTAEGYYVRDQFNRLPVYDDTAQAMRGGLNYMMHATKTVAAGAATCRHISETDSIGCFTQANPCAIGFAGREGVAVAPNIVGLSLRNIAPTQQNVENLVTTAATTDDYPLARKLYFNSIKGFQHPDLQQGEWQLARCMATDMIVGPIAVARNFVRVPTSGSVNGVFCEDFNETRTVANGGCGSAAANSNACGDNTGLFPFCGDGRINQLTETCDDGNTTGGDGCSATCTTE
jgi:cysteine-rich repeat protein